MGDNPARSRAKVPPLELHLVPSCHAAGRRVNGNRVATKACGWIACWATRLIDRCTCG